MRLNWTVLKKPGPAKTIGSFLAINLPELDVQEVKAKVDTGAYNGSLHASRIKEYTDKHGNTYLKFSPLGSKGRTVKVTNYHKRRVKSSNGVSVSRYAIDTEVVIMDQAYPITLTLANRSFMRYKMLLGRKFIRSHGFLVDVNRVSQ